MNKKRKKKTTKELTQGLEKLFKEKGVHENNAVLFNRVIEKELNKDKNTDK